MAQPPDPLTAVPDAVAQQPVAQQPVAPPALADIEAAAARLDGVAVRTPLLASPVLDERVGGRVLLKAETLQRTGSFKFRGAFNRISLIPEARRAAGVVACSSGNHAQGVAEAARLFGIPATIVMPRDAPATKRLRTERSGARVVPYERAVEDRVAIAMAIAAETGATFIHPYDDPGVIAGQGTVGLEIAADCAARGIVPDAVLVPVSGGGLTAGIALALAARCPDCRIFTTEPEGFDDHRRSLAAGTRVANSASSGSIADALMSEMPGEVTFQVNRERVAGGLGVDDAALLRAIRFAVEELKLVVEPGGATALAALLEGAYDARGRTVVVVLSGGLARHHARR
jgi:threonine dehydratase